MTPPISSILFLACALGVSLESRTSQLGAVGADEPYPPPHDPANLFPQVKVAFLALTTWHSKWVNLLSVKANDATKAAWIARLARNPPPKGVTPVLPDKPLSDAVDAYLNQFPASKQDAAKEALLYYLINGVWWAKPLMDPPCNEVRDYFICSIGNVNLQVPDRCGPPKTTQCAAD